MSQTFSQFKTDFYKRVPDLSVFDCEDFNLLKVVLDGLVVDYVKRNMRAKPLFQNSLIANSLLFVKRVKYRKVITESRINCSQASEKLQVPFLFYDNARVANDPSGKKVSFYFNRIEDYLGYRNCITIYQKDSSRTEGHPL